MAETRAIRLFFAPLLIVALTAAAQLGGTPNMASAPAPTRITVERPHIEPFSLDSSHRMTVPVRVNGGDSYPFVIDTGSERTIISRELALRLGLDRSDQVMLSTLSGRLNARSYQIAALDTANVRMVEFTAPALGGQDIGAAGLLGIDSLRNKRVIFDFRAKRLELRHSVPRESATVRDYDTITVSARTPMGRLVLSNATIDGRRVDVIIDTGAQTSVGNLAMMRLVAKRKLNRVPFLPSTLTSITGDRITAQRSIVTRLDLAQAHIVDLPVSFADAHAFKTLGLDKRPAMLLGMDALDLFDRVEIDFANRRVVFDLPDTAQRSEGKRYASTKSRLGV